MGYPSVKRSVEAFLRDMAVVGAVTAGRSIEGEVQRWRIPSSGHRVIENERSMHRDRK